MEEILSNLSYSANEFGVPIAQYGPGLTDTSLAMMDLFTHPIFKKEITTALEYNVPVISETQDVDFLLQHILTQGTAPDDHSEAVDNIPLAPTRSQSIALGESFKSFTLEAVKADFRENSTTIGFVVSVVPWDAFFYDTLPRHINGIVVEVFSDCDGGNITYVLNGGKRNLARRGNWHDDKYDHLQQQYMFFWKEHAKGTSRHCHFDLMIYPSDDFAQDYLTNDPANYAIVVVAIVAFAAVLLFAYHRYQELKHAQFKHDKARADAILESLFPRMSMQLQEGAPTDIGGKQVSCVMKPRPMADFYPSATIMFADIVNFTSWCSAREPFQGEVLLMLLTTCACVIVYRNCLGEANLPTSPPVFTLLETLFQAFDALGKKRRIFKVETVSPCQCGRSCAVLSPSQN